MTDVHAQLHAEDTKIYQTSMENSPFSSTVSLERGVDVSEQASERALQATVEALTAEIAALKLKVKELTARNEALSRQANDQRFERPPHY